MKLLFLEDVELEIVEDFDEENDCIVGSYFQTFLIGDIENVMICSVNENYIHVQFDDGSVSDVALESIKIVQMEGHEGDMLTPCEYSILLERM